MQNEMRDRLVELIYEARKGWDVYFNNCLLKGKPHTKTLNEFIADHLIENGVIVLPCKVGDDVYIPYHYNGTRGIAYFEVTHIIIDGKKSYVKTNFETDDDGFWELFNGGKFCFDDFGKTVFLTKEEAEQKLKGGGQE